ncbi:MAG TPA: hypothetical protein VK473_01805 [Terriglobales bacterium]|nr:hypothetical protein [Terriglobales bacterium]
MPSFRSHALASLFALLAAASLSAQDPAIAPQAPPNAIPEGTRFLIRLNDKLDTRNLQQGKHFKAKLAEDLVAGNGALIPRGKTIKGHVSAVEQGLHARMMLSFDEIDTGHGSMPLIATVTGVPGDHAVKEPGDEGELQRKGMSKEHEIEAVAVGAGIGAAAGAVRGGGKGAGIGAGAGAGVGAIAGLLTDHDLRLEKGTVLEVRLDHPLQIPR